MSNYTKEKHFNDTLDIFPCYKDPKESVANFTRSLPTKHNQGRDQTRDKEKEKNGFLSLPKKHPLDSDWHRTKTSEMGG